MSDYIYKQIKNYILNLLREHNFDPNYKLPSDNQLALKFNVSRVSVRKAFTELENSNVIMRLKGKGTFAKPKDENPAPDSTLMLILPSSESAFSNNIMRGVMDYCDTHNIGLTMSFSFCSKKVETQCFKNALNLKSKGILVMPFADDYNDNDVIFSITKKTPTVFIDRKPKCFNLPCVSSNHREITYKAVEYLHNKNHNDILLVSPDIPISSVVDREKGYLDAINDFGIESPLIFKPNFSNPEKIDEEYVDFLTKNKVSAIITSSGDTALRLCSNMKHLGKELSIDYDLVLIDNESYYFESILGKKIPTIIQDGVMIGYTACKLIHRALKNGKIDNSTTFVPTIFKYENL